jgi:N-acyl-D-amino-acid deacylase
VPTRTSSRVRRVGLAGLTIVLVAGTGLAQQPPAEVFDVVLIGGSVIDGTGNPWFRADVGIRDGRIVAIGVLRDAEAARRIDVTNRFVVPGFIDIHSHADEGLDAEGAAGTSEARRRAAPNLVSQGITTVVINQDGRSAWPISEQRAKLERLRIGPNAALMVGHNSIRAIALGDDFRRPATPAEVERMRDMVRQAMQEGAYGLSAGLEYVPGRWSTTEEVLALVDEAGRGGGVYIVHERSSGLDPMWYWPSHDPPGPPTMIHTIIEDIEIAERTGVTTVATHIKARGANFWGSGRTLIDLIERARARGVSIWADHYPYNTTGSDGSTVLIPDWFIGDVSGEERPPRADFASALEEALTDPKLTRDLRTDIAHEIRRRGGPDNLIVFEYPDSSAIGRSLAALASASGVDAVEMAIRLQLEGFANRPGGARIRGFSLSEIDVEAFAAQPWVATASDAGIALPDDGPVHARYYGTFPRKISRYAVERGVVRIEDAIRSATSLPAQILAMKDRGLLREGYRADVAVLDLDALRDRATFFEPHQHSAGVDYVMVNGELVVDRGEFTYALPGRILTPSGNAGSTTVEEGGGS